MSSFVYEVYSEWMNFDLIQKTLKTYMILFMYGPNRTKVDPRKRFDRFVFFAQTYTCT